MSANGTSPTINLPLQGPVVKPFSGNAPKSLVVLLHGLGADGNDLINLAPIMAQSLPDTLFVAPDAPQACDMAPMGKQWFSLQNRDYDSIHSGAMSAAPLFNDFLDGMLTSLRLTEDRMVLLGFSQGAMMATYVGLRRPLTCAGILSYSGWLIGGDALGIEMTAKPPVRLFHGDQDEVVTHDALQAGVNDLCAVGVDAIGESRPGLGHSIDEVGLKMGTEFIQKVLNQK